MSMIMKCVRFGLAGCFVAIAGCATSFTGSPHVENGRAGCDQKCKSQGMETSGMVYMGEYSDACVCSVPGQSAKAGNMKLMGAVAGSGAAAAGVVMQQRKNDNNNSILFR